MDANTNMVNAQTITNAYTNLFIVLSNSVTFPSVGHAPTQTGLELKILIPFFSALLGALAAFCFAWIKQWMDTRRQRYAALLEAQYALFSQWAILVDISEWLEELRHDEK